MPIYSMENTETKEIFEITLSIKEREEYLSSNPHIKQIFTKPPLYAGDSIRLNGPKATGGFKEVLQNVKSHHKHSTIDC